jgi:hypothetical protein
MHPLNEVYHSLDVLYIKTAYSWDDKQMSQTFFSHPF